MGEGYTDQGNGIHPKKLLDSLLPEIGVTVRWACRCYQLFPDHSVIEDLTQEIIFLLIKNDSRNLHSFAHRSTEKTWLQTVVLHYVCRHFKSHNPIERLEDVPINALPSQYPSQEMMVLFKERQKLVDTVRGELTGRERELWDGLRSDLSDEEIAKQMKIKIRSVQRKKCALLKKIGSLVLKL